MVLFPIFAFYTYIFVGNTGQVNVFYDVREQKKRPFYAIKTRS